MKTENKIFHVSYIEDAVWEKYVEAQTAEDALILAFDNDEPDNHWEMGDWDMSDTRRDLEAEEF